MSDKQEDSKHSTCVAFSIDTKSSSITSNSISESSLSLSESETDEIDFHPELFGLLDNPGVVRFGCLDYPLAVTEDSHLEYETVTKHDNAPDWIRVSCDDLNVDVDGPKNSLDNVHGNTKKL